MTQPEIDIVVLSRDAAPLRREVAAGLQRQSDVVLHVHRVIGEPGVDDACRWQTITRARNAGKQLGRTPWLMFVDDDVVLQENCVRQLWESIRRRKGTAAVAADYLGESQTGDTSLHVAMGATLFRRDVLDHIRFRWKPDQCECLCCSHDLRKMRWKIQYVSEARAMHLLASAAEQPVEPTASGPTSTGIARAPQVFAAFDRRHFKLFIHRFLPSLRRGGNHGTVQAVAIGLYPSERRRLSRLPQLAVTNLSQSGVAPPKRRLTEFQRIIEKLPAETPVAYWDAGDVIFQGSLAPLWQLVRQNPTKLLAVREPISHPENASVRHWTLSIEHPVARNQAFDLLSQRPCLNSGFAAGTAKSMLRYLRYAERLIHSPGLRGSVDWGDQTALNLYCHANPDAWREIPQGWNYCLFGRAPDEVHFDRDGYFRSLTGEPIVAIHGNGGSLGHFVRTNPSTLVTSN